MGSVEVVTVLYGLPLAAAGLIWLIAVTNLDLILQNWVAFTVFAGLIVIFETISYFLYFENEYLQLWGN